MGWGNFLSGLMDKIPIQGRTERWKNEIDKLEQRQSYISIHMRDDLANEYDRNERRLQKLNKLCQSKI